MSSIWSEYRPTSAEEQLRMSRLTHIGFVIIDDEYAESAYEYVKYGRISPIIQEAFDNPPIDILYSNPILSQQATSGLMRQESRRGPPQRMSEIARQPSIQRTITDAPYVPYTPKPPKFRSPVVVIKTAEIPDISTEYIVPGLEIKSRDDFKKIMDNIETLHSGCYCTSCSNFKCVSCGDTADMVGSCGHVLLCDKCVAANENCPLCGLKTDFKRLILSDTCCICMNDNINQWTVFPECGHTCCMKCALNICYECGDIINCPCCRGRIKGFKPLLKIPENDFEVIKMK
jgi:hypothetical protein